MMNKMTANTVIEWREITQKMLPHWGGLYVNNFGEVKTHTGKKITPQVEENGTYLICYSKKNGNRCHIALAKLVAMAFVPNPNPEEFKRVIHISKDFSDNTPENLKWGTFADMARHARPNTKSVYYDPVLIIDKDNKLVCECQNGTACAVYLGISQNTASRHIKSGKRYNGFYLARGSKREWDEGKIEIHEQIPFRRPRNSGVIQKSLSGEIVAEYTSVTEVENKLGFAHSAIFSCIDGALNSAYGYKWEQGTRSTQTEQRKKWGSVIIQCDAELKEIGRYIGSGEASRKTGVSTSCICSSCNSGRPTKGFYFFYEEDLKTAKEGSETLIIEA